MQWVIEKDLNAVKRFKESNRFKLSIKEAASCGNLEILKLLDNIFKLDFQFLLGEATKSGQIKIMKRQLRMKI